MIDYTKLFIAVLVLSYVLYALIRREFQWKFGTVKQTDQPVRYWLSIAFFLVVGGGMLMLGMNICLC